VAAVGADGIGGLRGRPERSVQISAEVAAECACDGLRRASRGISSLYEAALAPFHLTATQFTILVALHLRGRVPLSRLAQGPVQGIGEGRALIEILHQNILPSTLRAYPGIVLQFLVMRENFIKRVYHQRTGYWKPDGEGIEVVAPSEWAGALNLLAGRQEEAFVRSARALLEQGDDVLALKLADLGLVNYPASRPLTDLRRRALDRLRVRHEQLNPFKFIIYSEWAGAELLPVE
jgi:hypothetical protein